MGKFMEKIRKRGRPRKVRNPVGRPRKLRRKRGERSDEQIIKLIKSIGPRFQRDEVEVNLEVAAQETEWIENGQFEDCRNDGLKRWLREHGKL
jgi:hypothetical protein